MIREYVKEDISSINKLGKDLHSNFDFKLDTYSKCLVCEDNKIVGFIIYSIIYERAEIIDIIVDEKERRKGYGNKLIKKAIEDIKLNKCNNITLEVKMSNKGAITLYSKHGFKVVSNRKDYYDNEDAFLMELEM